MKSLLILIFSVVVLIMTPLVTFAEEKSPYEIPEKLTEEEISGLEEERAGVEPPATVSKDAVCGDGIYERDKGETYENCPQDCIPEGEVKPEEERTGSQPVVTVQVPVPATPTFSVPEWRLVGGIIAGSVVFGILVYFLARRKRGTS